MKSENGLKKNKIKKLKSINSAMWGYFCLFALVLIVLMFSVFSVVTVTTLEDSAKQKIENVGKAVCAQLVSGGDLKQFERREDGVNVYVFSQSSQLLLPENGVAQEDSEAKFNEVQKQLENAEDGQAVIYRDKGTVKYAVEILNGQGESYFVLATYSLFVVHETLSTMLLYMGITCAVALVLALLISYAISQKFTRGLKSMSDTAVNLADGDYSVQFTNVDFAEMAQLSDSLNYVRDEVKKSEDFQHEILANVTHDLKTPLTMIKAYASMIKEISGENKEKREKHLQVIIDEADRLTGLVNDVLSVSKIQANINTIAPKVFNLTELLYSIINKFGYLQETSGYSFMLDIDQNLYTRADSEKISQVFYNLLGNAANYTGEDKTVYISLKQNLDGKRIKFTVRDTGKGISKEDLPEIWNRYYRVDENHSRPVKGTGLGLNIVKVILENHSFDFGVESGAGSGSSFWVDFPSFPAEIG